jgi:protein-disulfide isomerase
VLTFERIPEPVPANFTVYGVTLRSTDQYCGAKKFLLYSPKSQQVLLGTIVPLPVDSRPAAVRLATETSDLLKAQIAATVSPFPLPDGIKSVTLTKTTPFGNFGYHGFLDATERFLIVGARGSLTTDPSKTLLESLNAANAVRRGKKTSKVEILELSDFQCPTCGKAHLKIEPIIRAALGDISYARLDLPLFEHHQWALPAALGGRAIQRVAPAKYWDYVDWIFKNQEAIEKMKFDDVLKGWVEDHDVDWKAVDALYRSPAERSALLDQVSRAFDVGINSTPTFIINGQIMGFGPDGEFTIAAIKAAIASTKGPAKTASKKK